MDYILQTILRDGPYIEQHGVKGQKWYVRRYQNTGSDELDEIGRKRCSRMAKEQRNIKRNAGIDTLVRSAND